MQARFLCITAPLFHRSIARSTSTQLRPQFHLQPIIYKRQYTMAQAMHGHSAACCSIPPIVSKGYEPKGKYETIGGLKTCKFCTIPSQLPRNRPPASCTFNCLELDCIDVTGPANATKAILYIYDIFGYFPQSIQGADILSTSDKDNQYQVFMPDWFEGNPADISW
jgi:hypothetical protein